MEVAVLTTRLEAQISAFQTQMAAAERMLKQVQGVMRDLEKTTVELQATMKKLGVDASEMDKGIAKLKELGGAVKDLRTQFVEANRAAGDLTVPAAQTAKNIAEINAQTRAVKELRDAEIEANLAALRVQTRSRSGQFAGKAIPISETGLSSDRVQGMAEYNRYLGLLSETMGLGRQSFINRARSIGSFGPDENVLRPYGGGIFAGSYTPLSRESDLGRGDVRGAERFLKGLGFELTGGGGTRGSRTGGGGIGGGAVGGFFRGILPGGRRAGAGAVLTGLGLLAGAGPAAVPAAGGLAVGAVGAMTALVGAAATLKLAFADMSAAAFTSKAAFDQLAPAQQSLVLSLKSLDAGVVRPLENIAQQNLIPKLTMALHTLVSPAIIGAVQKSVGSFATGIGQGAQNVAGILGSSEFSQNFQKVMVADSFYVNQFITDLGKLTDSFFRILAVGRPFTDWLSGLGVKFSDWVQSVTQSTAANGKMAQFFDHAKQGLQTIGGLLMGLTGIASAFGDAFGFQNSISLINTFTRLFEMLAGFIKQNQTVLKDFFGGALKAINDVLSAIQPLLDLLSRLLGMVNKLIGGMTGWRVVIDAVVAAFTLKMVSGMIAGFARIGLAEDALITETSALRVALMSLSSVEVLGGLAVLAAAIYAVYKPQAFISPGPDPSRGHGTGIISASLAKGLIRGKTPFATDTATDKAAYDLGGGQYLAQTASGKWKLYHMSGGVNVPGLASGFQASPAVTAAVAATAPRKPTMPVGDLSGLNPGTAVNQILSQMLGLPQNIQTQVNAAAAGHGNQAKASAAAYAYYNKLLKIPGLTAAQKSMIYAAQAPYTPPEAFQLTGGGGIGFTGPTTAGGAVFNAQTAVQQALTTGSGASFSQQLSLAKQYERSAAAAYTHLKNQKVAAADINAKQSELTTLLKDEAQARQYISRITAGQAKALAKMVDDSRKTQISQHRTEISAIRSGLSQGVSGAATPAAAVAAVNTALRAAGRQLEQLRAFKDKLLAQDKQTSQLKTEENQIQSEINATLGVIRTAQKDQAKVLKAQIQAQATGRMARILGIGTGTGEVSAARELGHVRSFLDPILKRFGLGVSGSRQMEPLVKELYKNGDINKRQLSSLEKIFLVIKEARDSNAKIESSISGNISERLKQIKDELAPGTGFSNLNPVTTEQQILKNAGIHISGTAAQRARFMEQANEALGLRGHLHRGSGGALGIPLNPDGTPAMIHPGIAHHLRSMGGGSGPHARQLLSASYNADPWSRKRMYDINLNSWRPNVDPKYNPAAAGPVQGETHVTINVNGYNKDIKALAAEIYTVFQKNRRRNATMLTGANAGRNLGSGLG